MKLLRKLLRSLLLATLVVFEVAVGILLWLGSLPSRVGSLSWRLVCYVVVTLFNSITGRNRW